MLFKEIHGSKNQPGRQLHPMQPIVRLQNTLRIASGMQSISPRLG